jgi:hypothetical protein
MQTQLPFLLHVQPHALWHAAVRGMKCGYACCSQLAHVQLPASYDSAGV